MLKCWNYERKKKKLCASREMKALCLNLGKYSAQRLVHVELQCFFSGRTWSWQWAATLLFRQNTKLIRSTCQYYILTFQKNLKIYIDNIYKYRVRCAVICLPWINKTIHWFNSVSIMDIFILSRVVPTPSRMAPLCTWNSKVEEIRQLWYSKGISLFFFLSRRKDKARHTDGWLVAAISIICQQLHVSGLVLSTSTVKPAARHFSRGETRNGESCTLHAYDRSNGLNPPQLIMFPPSIGRAQARALAFRCLKNDYVYTILTHC